MLNYFYFLSFFLKSLTNSLATRYHGKTQTQTDYCRLVTVMAYNFGEPESPWKIVANGRMSLLYLITSYGRTHCAMMHELDRRLSFNV